MNMWVMRSIAGLFASVIVSLMIMLLLLLPRILPGVPEHPRFKAGEDNIVRRYYWVGTLKEIWTVQDGRANGPMVQLYPNGSIMRELYYADSRLEGPAREYYEKSAGSVRMSRRRPMRPSEDPEKIVGGKGELKAEWSYRDGIKEGPYAIYAENGGLKEEGNYSAGKKIRWKSQ